MSNKTTLSGNLPDIPEGRGGAPGYIDLETGQHSDYWILSKEERSKGFVRPVRETYLHTICGVKTSMPYPIAETFARMPNFYGATFCCGCHTHQPVTEFLWLDNTAVGS